MSFIDWSDQFSVNNLSIDFEHKKLVLIINDLHDSMKRGKSSKVLGSTLENLIAYTKTHFRNEERIMVQQNYTDIEEHKREHRKFVAEIEALHDKYRSGAVSISISLMNFLKTWLVDHIQGSDKKFWMALAKAS